jgi:branched-subunit amino acid aminotransferase/4-amino-4-deoxychorismate lyase
MMVVEFLFLDGNPLVEKIPLRSLLYAEGVFETFRWRGAPPVFLGRHLDRMRQGSEFLSIPFPGGEDIKSAVEDAIRSSNLTDAYVKVCLLSSGPTKFYKRAGEGHVLVIVRSYEPSKERMRAHVASFKRNSSSPLLRVKSLNYLENVLARREAQGDGCDEAIFLNERGDIAEGSSTNIFWVRENVLYTPAVDCGLLPGITREALVSLAPEIGLNVVEGGFDLNEILSSDGAFLTNSLIGIAALTGIDEVDLKPNEELFVKLRTTLFKKFRWIP